MNSYSFRFLVEPTTPPVIGDAATLNRLCKQLGYLCFAPRPGVVRVGSLLTITTGAFVATNATAGNPQVVVDIDSVYRLPSALMPPNMGATTSGEVVTAGAGIMASTTALDDKCSDILTNLDAPYVTRGCGIVAYLPAGVDVSDQLDAQVNIPVCNGQTIVIGRANRDALQGIYETPFSTAWTYAVFGGAPKTAVAVVDVKGQASMRK